MEAEVERLNKDGFPAEEAAKAKNQYRLGRFVSGNQGDEFTSLQTPLGRALALAEFTLFYGDPSLINAELDRYLAVTPEQIREAARKYFGTANRSVLYITPAEKKPGG